MYDLLFMAVLKSSFDKEIVGLFMMAGHGSWSGHSLLLEGI